MKHTISRPMLERLPLYAACLESLIQSGIRTVSSATLAKHLSLGDVQIRKELAFVSGAGRPRIGYNAAHLLSDIRRFLGEDEPCEAVIVGAGRLGRALLGYASFEEIGVHIGAAFDICPPGVGSENERVFPMDTLAAYCHDNHVKIGIITVPASAAQDVCERMLHVGITAIWNFASITLQVPPHVSVVNEKLAISLSQLRQTMIQ